MNNAWGGPSRFPGHEVVRIAYPEFSNHDNGGATYDVKFKIAYDSVNYVNEVILDSLKQFEGTEVFQRNPAFQSRKVCTDRI